MSVNYPDEHWRAVSKYFRYDEAHGTAGCYSAGCRCDECREASNEKRRLARLRANGIDITAKLPDDYRLYEPETWVQRAACAGLPSEMFFPDPGANSDARARRICQTCPVVDECLTSALKNKEKHGFWGGVPERRRRTLETMDLEEALDYGLRIRNAWTRKHAPELLETEPSR